MTDSKPILLILFFSLFSLALFPQEVKTDTLSVHAMRMLSELNASVIKYANQDKKSPDHGGIYCPHCKLYHTRAAEALYPFAFEYSKTGNKKYMKAAIDVGNWLIRQQQSNGSWLETPEEWTGTTTDQVLMMVLAYPLLKPHLSTKEQTSWLQSIEKAGDYLAKVMSPQFASINYCATTTASLMFVNELIDKQSYRDKARELAYQVVGKMDQDYFLTGEGGRVFGAKYGIDLGYNLEMSLWGLALYAKLAKDETVTSIVEKSLAKHIYFIYPDGSMDASWGIRSNKWTCFGSSTSDGCQVLFSLFMDKNDAYRTAAIRNIQFLQTCMKDGIVGFGPLYYEMYNYLPCIYPTFTKAKSMAMSIAFAKADVGKTELLPLDKRGMYYFPTLNLTLARTAQWCTTISGYTYKDPAGDRTKYMHRPGGGTITNLWLNGHGYFQASSQTIYKRWEPMSFPEIPDPLPLTPRIEFNSDLGNFTNLYEFDAIITNKEENGAYIVSSFGELKNSKQQEGGIAFRLSHSINDNSISKEIELIYHDARQPVRIIEPIIYYPNMKFEQVDQRTLRIKTSDKTIELKIISDNVTLEVGTDIDKYKWSYPALKAYPAILNVDCDKNDLRKTIRFTYQII
ncbi:hypothetical protein [Dysgonomonas sp. BGC7]|uniref:hypothetical protein n=1 Tax=Dysgonomonas sp. BGC7 TaxID=1658008 RepID=UPI00068048A3|nr:hypothetical protein [Dysgonomonas sp. BGC7]MBD8387740.1 hypothetical protein [Dysgonomonas sp. BGC7]